jgi:hypothetical protein
MSNISLNPEEWLKKFSNGFITYKYKPPPKMMRVYL